MIIILSFLIRMLSIRYCAYIGSRRVMGGLLGLVCGMLFSFFGVLFILTSRKLDDEHAAQKLAEKYKPIA